MEIKIGTFNLNNLFGRFNFKTSIEKEALSGTYTFNPEDKYWTRKFFGKLIEPKDEEETKQLAETIKNSGVHILAVQEVEDRDTLKRFNKEYLGGQYDYEVVIDGNDPRLIDVGLLSKYPLGAITSWQCYPKSENPNKPVFSRDLLQVEIFDLTHRSLLFTFFITHLKSKFIPFQQQGVDREEQTKQSNLQRLEQCNAIAEIIPREMGQDSRYVIAGDFNDTPDSEYLTPLLSGSLELENIVNRMPEDKRYTYVHEGKPQQIDYILVPPLMSEKLKAVEIGECQSKRELAISKCGSDHRPIFATLDL